MVQQQQQVALFMQRQLGRYDFEDGSYVQIVASGPVETEEALDMIKTIVELKRKELQRLVAARE